MASVQKQILHSVVTTTDRWITDIAANVNLAIVAFNRNQRFSNLATEKCCDTIGPARRRWQIVNRFFVVGQNKVDVRVGKRQPSERLDDVPFFGLGSFQKPMADGGIEEQILDFDYCSNWASTGNWLLDHSSTNVDFATGIIGFGTAANR